MDGPIAELPLEPRPAPDDSFETDSLAAPLEPEPAIDEVAPVADPVEGTGNQIVEQEPQPAGSEPLPQPSTPEPVATAPPPSPLAAEAPVVTQHEPQVRSAAAPKAEEQSARPPEPEHAEPPAPVPATPAQPDPVAVAATGSATVRVAQSTTTPREVTRSDRFHVVQRGESLWSIAKDLLGDDASVARIAREVNRLWELNSVRIGTGQPDLVMAGTRIALR
jgi:nucleoid-associated protein YgaU